MQYACQTPACKMRCDSCARCMSDSVRGIARRTGLGEEVGSGWALLTHVTVNTGASHKRGYSVDNTSHLLGCDVSEKLAHIMRCNSILSCMPDAASPCTRFQRRGCGTPCAAGGCTHDAGTHCRGARPPWVRRAWGLKRDRRGCDVLEKQAGHVRRGHED